MLLYYGSLYIFHITCFQLFLIVNFICNDAWELRNHEWDKHLDQKTRKEAFT